MNQMKLQSFLKATFDELQSKNSSYSLRAFARKLHESPSSLSEILNGKRKVSPVKARHLLQRLCLAPDKIEEILDTITTTNSQQGTNNSHKDISLDLFHVISDWHYFAIQSLAETQSFKEDPQWISNRLGIKILDVKKALTRLIKLGMLERDKNGNLRSSEIHFATPTDIANSSIQKSHFQALELSQESLEQDPVEDRDFSTITIAMDPADLPKAKEKIKEFRRNLAQFLESGEKKEVFKLNVQMFSLSKNKEK